MNDDKKINTIKSKWIFGLASVLIFIALVWRMEHLATLVILSFLGAYILNPVVNYLCRHKYLGRTASTIITLVFLLIVISIAFVFIVPEIVREIIAFAKKCPGYMNTIIEKVVPWIEVNFSVDIPGSFSETLGRFGKEINEVVSKAIGPATQIITATFSKTFSAVTAIISAFIFPMFLFFILKGFPTILKTVSNLFPPDNRKKLIEIGRDVDINLSAFLRGQFLVMLILGTLYSTGYLIVGAPMAIGIGMLTGILCFVPYVGAASGFALALLLSLLEYKGFGSILGVAAVFGIVQFLDAVLITPKIIGDKLGLNPLWIIIALMAGAELFGFLGIFLAVPSTAVIKVLIKHLLLYYRQSSLYTKRGT